MSRATFRIVLLVSFAHALVHAFEVSLPSVEQMIGDDFGVDKQQTGRLGTLWRIPFGVGALLAGWLADRYGSKRLLLVFLGGCVLTSAISFWAPTFQIVIVAMFAMGCFASIYHPAGLALISRETQPENRPAALGWHGIFGSVGFTCAPLIAALVFTVSSLSWRQYYLVLCLPTAMIAVLLAIMLRETPRGNPPLPNELDDTFSPEQIVAPKLPGRFFYLVLIGALSGFVYAGFMHFLPRYMDKALDGYTTLPAESLRNYLAAIVLGFAVIGQALAGRFAQPGRMERQLSLVLLANAPCLIWMAVAEGPWRLAAACLFALVHFMNQPLYNSLIAQFVPAERRSLGYGFSNMMCFGIGAFGPWFAGEMTTNQATYGGLAAIITIAGVLSLGLGSPRYADE